MIRDEYEGWTPKAVGEQLVEAIRWVRRTGGPVGPTGIRSGQPAYIATDEEYFEDWGLREVAEDDDEPRPRPPAPSPAQISRYEDALTWPGRYLIPAHEGSARMLCLWAMCKASKRPFDRAVKERAGISRGAAYLLRDRALSIISQRLEREGVKP